MRKRKKNNTKNTDKPRRVGLILNKVFELGYKGSKIVVD